MRELAAPRRRLGETKAAIELATRRRDSQFVLVAVAAGYLLTYLWTAGDLSLRSDVEPGLLVVSEPLGRVFLRTGPASFEAIAVLDTGVLRLLVSPMNIAIGLLIAVLVGISLALTYLAVVRPQACGLGAGSGLLASVPALLSGTVCCGPVVLLALGIQASGLLVSLFAWLLPLGVALLVGSLVYLGGKIDTSATSSKRPDQIT